MMDAKSRIEALLEQIVGGEVPAGEAWPRIQGLKEEYVKERGQQSWNSFVGHRFESMIVAILAGYFKRLPSSPGFSWEVLTEGQVQRDEVISRKICVKFGDYLVMPDIDSAIVLRDAAHPWESRIAAIVSCKTSLRERIAQSCYWKLKFGACETLKRISVFLATTDNDGDFLLQEKGKRYGGMSRDRVIAEYELDGVYIMNEAFGALHESAKVKSFERIFQDIEALASTG